MMTPIKISVTEEEWLAYPKDRRDKIKHILSDKYSIDISHVIILDQEEADGRD
jgi:hypothetical protein